MRFLLLLVVFVVPGCALTPIPDPVTDAEVAAADAQHAAEDACREGDHQEAEEDGHAATLPSSLVGRRPAQPFDAGARLLGGEPALLGGA